MTEGAIRVRGLVKAYPTADGKRRAGPVIDRLDLDIADHEFLCILGPSGCGKSTFLNIVSGLDRDYEGTIEIDGRHIGERGATTRISYLFQDDRLMPWLTAERNIDFVLDTCRIGKERRAGIKDHYFDLVGLSAFRNHYPHQLSGGMRQRLALVRALCVEPKVLLMDEPFSGLDELTARRLRVDLLRIWREMRKTIVFVTHNAYEASFLADRILVMSRGRIAEEVRVDVPRPRQYDDEAVFRVNQRVVRRFLEVADAARDGEEQPVTAADPGPDPAAIAARFGERAARP